MLFSFRFFGLLLVFAMISATQADASDHVWTGAVSDDFFTAGNWDIGTAPVGPEALAVIDNGQVVTIAAGTGEIELGGFQLGTSGPTGGGVIQNGGTLIIAGTAVDAKPTAFEFKSHIGDQGTLASSWVMNNDATILYDGPLDGDGQGLGTDGINSYDLEIGARIGVDGGVGVLELHDNAVLRISDDLKIGAEDFGNGIVSVDGNAQITVGSGISLGEDVDGVGRLNISGSGLVVTGNSAAPGDTVDGRTNEGYLTLSTDNTGLAEVNVSENGRLYARTLQQRQGESIVNLSGDAQLHVFEVFEFAEPEFATATVQGSTGSERTSHVSSGLESRMTFNIADNASMSVDSDLPDSEWSGLALSGGTNRGGNADGGFTIIDIQDSGSLTIVQDLHMTMGFDPGAESVLSLTGPDASVLVIGDLRMAVDPGDNVNPGKATIQAVLTADTHSTIEVGGSVNIDNAGLVVSFGEDYAPNGGESYTLITASSVNGEFFKEFELPELTGDLSWDFDISETEVVLLVTGGPAPTTGDFDADGELTVADIDILNSNIAAGSDEASFDINGDGLVDLGDQATWLSQAATENGFDQPYLAGDTNLDGVVNANDLNEIGLNWQQAASNWSQGDLNADGVVNATDLNVIGLNWQSSIAAAAQTAAVPEPASWVLLLPVLVAFGVLRK